MENRLRTSLKKVQTPHVRQHPSADVVPLIRTHTCVIVASEVSKLLDGKRRAVSE